MANMTLVMLHFEYSVMYLPNSSNSISYIDLESERFHLNIRQYLENLSPDAYVVGHGNVRFMDGSVIMSGSKLTETGYTFNGFNIERQPGTSLVQTKWGVGVYLGNHSVITSDVFERIVAIYGSIQETYWERM